MTRPPGGTLGSIKFEDTALYAPHMKLYNISHIGLDRISFLTRTRRVDDLSPLDITLGLTIIWISPEIDVKIIPLSVG